MKLHNSAVLALSLILLVGCGEETVSIDSIVKAETQFAADVEGTSIKQGFLKHLDADAVVFMPSPTNAHKVYGGVEITPSRLVWVPEVVDIDSDGEFGWASGPWLYYPDKETETPIEAGVYVTVWQKKDGKWKALLDMGIPHDPVDLEGVEATLWGGERGVTGDPTDPGQLVETIGRSEQHLAQRSMELGYRTALLEVADPAIRVLRSGDLPASGNAEATALLQGETGAANWEPAGIVVAESGEIAFAFGTGNAELAAEDREFAYTRIWRLGDEGWHVALDIRDLIPVRPEVQEDAAP